MPYSGALSLEDLVRVNAHLGHKKGMWNPKMKPYLFGSAGDMHIIDLEQTVPMLQRALDVTRGVAASNGIVLFLDTRPEFERSVRRAALACEEYYISRLFMKGSFANCWQMLGTSRRPDLIVFLSPPSCLDAVQEATHCHIPTIGLVDSNADPTSVMFPVPANDDTPEAVEYFLSHFVRAVRQGKANKVLQQY